MAGWSFPSPPSLPVFLAKDIEAVSDCILEHTAVVSGPFPARNVAQRVRFTHLLANDHAMATAYCGMDDDAMRFMEEECVASWSSDHYDRYAESKDSDNYSDGGETKEHSKFIEDDENDETKGSTPRNNNDEHTADMDYADSK
ncbi:hypothetical protein PHYSODRAFT_327133 [Phytophthora sojae]|uniref:Uncharacterized protein n=1 Tax=Phytophthora sojae (strain P6497) TaxID=1094619 RepID=G4YY49_PHYSP|nr:hypothetical protein PHYSODRAFT_327133 [Phytophthora sojae]EGZ26217.1 hypothetical protein PHYSODRAFT_327133 [Phytophthora sojae]|eukprot:XP_009521505.1 hypothetical protein PHYSODRAFT_327133 [Phytophthora sojae]